MTTRAESFYITGGTLRHDAPCYVERQADRDLYSGLLGGEFCYVLTSRQMGKSSLMVRTANRLRECEVNVIALDLTAIGQNLSPEQWYDGLLMRLGQQLNLESEVEEAWNRNNRLGPCQRFFTVLRDVVLPLRSGAFVIFVDEIDTVRSLPFSTDEFFSAIRECYNRRGEDPEFRRLTFCLLGVATPSDLIRDTRTTPFNIGRRIELHDFTETEAAPLAKGLQHLASSKSTPTSLQRGAETGSGIRRAKRLLSRILFWTGGHPYLTQRFCQAASEQDKALDAAGVDLLCEELFLSSRAKERDDNLLFVRERLLRSEADLPSLLEHYWKIHRGKRINDDETSPLISLLRLSGIVRAERGCLRNRNRIYATVFDRNWIRAHMPDAELRRQRLAFWRGVAGAASIAAVVVAMMGGLVAYARRQAQRAETLLGSLQQADRDRSQAESRSRRLVGLAGQRFDGVDGIRLFPTVEHSLELRNEAIACLSLPDLRKSAEVPRWPANSAAFALGEKLDRYARVDATGRVSVHRWASHSEVACLPGPLKNVAELRLSPGGAYLATVQPTNNQRRLSVHRLASLELAFSLNNVAGGQAVDFSHDDKLIAVGGDDSTVQVFDLTKGQRVMPLEGSGLPTAVRFRPGSSQFAVAWSNLFAVQIINAASEGDAVRLPVAGAIEAISWSPDGRLLAAACVDRRVFLWDMETGSRLPTLDGHQAAANRLVFSPSGKILASAGGDQTVRLWDCLTGGKPLVTLTGPREIQQMAFAPDERQLAAVSADGEIHLWELALAAECRALTDPEMLGISDLDVSPDGRWLACARAEGVSFWDVETGRLLGGLALGETSDVAFDPVNGELFTSDLTGVNRFPMQQRTTARSVIVEFGHGRNLGLQTQARQLACSANGGLVAISWHDSVVVIRTKDGSTQAKLQGVPDITSVALSRDGDWVATAHAASGEVCVWDGKQSSAVTNMPLGGRVNVAFSPSGNWLAASGNRDFRVWQTGTWKEVLKAQRNSAGGGSPIIAFSPDSRTLALSRSDSIVDLIAIPSGVTLASFEPPRRNSVVALRFSPDGTRLFCGTEGATIWVWDLSLLRSELAELGLDWPSASLPPRATVAEIREPSLTVGSLVLDGTPSTRMSKESELRRVTAELEKKSANPDLWRKRAGLYEVVQDFSSAISDWRHYLSLTNDAWAWRDLAWIHIWGPPEFQNFTSARTEATNAVELEPNNEDNHYRLAVATAMGRDHATALTHLNAAEVVLRPDSSRKARILMAKAVCEARLGHTNNAIAFYEHAQELMAQINLQPIHSKPIIEWQHLEQEAKLALGR